MIKAREKKEKLEREKKTKQENKQKAKAFRENFKNNKSSVEITKDGMKSKIYLFETSGGFSKAVLYYTKLLNASQKNEKEEQKEPSIINNSLSHISEDDIESEVEEIDC